ncbi:MAG UNVERIFIED_CONTAM: right-handed parallel beta-helix repeat-containing protein [Planctomycetaceae bacterium]
MITDNDDKGILFQSYSFGLGTNLPLPQGNFNAVVATQDLGYSVSIGTESPGQGNISNGGNTLHSNRGAGIALEALDYGTGSFEIWNNTITSTEDDANAATPYTGDGIFIRLDDGRIVADAAAILQQSVIRNNVIGVDNQGNAGNGLFFSMKERTRIQTLDVVFNTFLNNGRDGFHFERSEDARLNLLRFEKNRATNNTGDGFDLFAKNTTLDRLDIDINDNFVEDNGQYGLRVDAQADARMQIQFDNNSVRRNGHTPAGQGFHGNDGTVGSLGAAGGIGIRGFQQIDIILNATDTIISDNIGDGLSIDAFNYFDTLRVSSQFTRVTFDNNTRAGLRNHGAAFGGFDLFDCSLSNNGEDGFRSISVEDKSDPYFRRVGCMDLDLRVMRSEFNNNGQDGVHLGQGLSAIFGDGTQLNSNSFDFNGRSGLMITQHNSPYLDRLTSLGDERRRHVQVNFATFMFNGAAGVDIGIDPTQEPSNVEQGDEVASDIAVTIDNAQLLATLGDGVEYLGDDTFRIPRLRGGGQDWPARFNSALEVSNSRIANNGGRGVDILNRHQQDVYVTLAGNEILSNTLEGIYVFNTASINQRQVSSADQVLPDLTGSAVPNPNIELRIQQNLIQSNGSFGVQSRVPTIFERGPNDAGGTPVVDWMHGDTLIPGTLGGLVIRVGTADTIGQLPTADPGNELSLSGIDAEIWQNRFDGNFGTDVYFDSIVTQVPPHTRIFFDVADDPDFLWTTGYRDPLPALTSPFERILETRLM